MLPENESSELPSFRKSNVIGLSAFPSSETKMKDQNFFTIKKKEEIYEIPEKKEQEVVGKLKTIFKILKYANSKDTTILIIGTLAAVGTGLLGPINVFILMTPLLTSFIDSKPGSPIHINVTVEFAEFGYRYFMFGGMNIVFSFTQIMASEIASRNIMLKIKSNFIRKMMSLEMSSYDRYQEELVCNVSHDLQKMIVLFDSTMTSAAEMISFFFFGCVAGFVVSWEVALMTLILMLISMTVTYFIMKASKKREKLQENYSGKCIKIASEVIENSRLVAAYGGKYKEIERYKKAYKAADKHGLKHALIISMAKAFNYFQLCTCYMITYYFSVRLYLVGHFNPGYMAIILSTQINAIYHCTYLFSTVSELIRATCSAYKVMKFLDAETNYNKTLRQCIASNIFENSVSFRNVQFSYPTSLDTKVLHDLTLDIEPGKITAIVGTSGAGKSSIIDLITCLYDVTAGQILIGGVDIRKFNVNWLRSQISVVGPEPLLFDVSVEENIRYGKTTATLEEIIEAAKISYAHRFIEKLPFSYSSIIGEISTKLSRGQQQRIILARAIIRNPKLLLLDEVTSSLDSHSEGIVQDALDNVMCNRTTLIITHKMTTVRKADIIYAMKEGCVVEKGTHSQLMELKGYYYSMVQTHELEEKDKAVTINQGSASKEEFIEPFDIGKSRANSEVPEIEKDLRLRTKNLRVMAVCLLAILFAAVTSAFLPSFYSFFSLFCHSYIHQEKHAIPITIVDVSILIVMGVVAFFSVVLSGMMSTIATQLWLEKLQKKVFNKIVSMEICWFDKSGNSPNECLEVLTNSPPLIESVTGERASQVAIFILSLLFSFVYSLFISTKVTLVNLPIIIIFLIINCLRMKSRDADTRSASLAIRSAKVAIEYAQNVRTIKILNCQKYIINQYRDMLSVSKRDAFVSIVWYAVVYAVSKTLIRLSMGTTFMYGANDISNGDVRGTSLIGVVSALNLASALAGPALISIKQYPAARQAITKFYRIAYSKTCDFVLKQYGVKPEINGSIIFKDVVFSYPTKEDVQVFKKLNLKIEAGKTVALLGDSGCGKSTIISLLERFYHLNEGKIMIDGYDIYDINVRYLRSQMGFVSQKPVLFDMTIKENILYGLEEEVTMDKVIEAAKLANIHDCIMNFPQAYDTLVGERGSNLSSEQRQRIAIARAVLRNPKILLLDEATSALDTQSQKVMIYLISDFEEIFLILLLLLLLCLPHNAISSVEEPLSSAAILPGVCLITSFS
ncbi:unnamed protein product [Nezara viridula]|uniref:ABC-type xenobiotic transporter n=1 Tax=Nezara viridula TaxID=85310 RepID=A0A9P0H0M3_NEZVI|nr:unnamed protein product [Nezara viridula]